jgi:hypothetical protein
VKSILVEPGQIGTNLFAGVQTPSRFLAPVLDTSEVCKAITALVDAGEGGVLRMPRYAAWVEWFGVLPVSVQRLVRWASRVDVSMRRAGEKKRSEEEQQQKKTGIAHGHRSEVKDKDSKSEESASSDDLVVVDKM